MVEPRFALVRYDDDRKNLYVKNVSEIKEKTFKNGKGVLVPFQPQGLNDFDKSRWYRVLWECSESCDEDHEHIQYYKSQILKLSDNKEELEDPQESRIKFPKMNSDYSIITESSDSLEEQIPLKEAKQKAEKNISKTILMKQEASNFVNKNTLNITEDFSAIIEPKVIVPKIKIHQHEVQTQAMESLSLPSTSSLSTKHHEASTSRQPFGDVTNEKSKEPPKVVSIVVNPDIPLHLLKNNPSYKKQETLIHDNFNDDNDSPSATVYSRDRVELPGCSPIVTDDNNAYTRNQMHNRESLIAKINCKSTANEKNGQEMEYDGRAENNIIPYHRRRRERVDVNENFLNRAKTHRPLKRKFVESREKVNLNPTGRERFVPINGIVYLGLDVEVDEEVWRKVDMQTLPYTFLRETAECIWSSYDLVNRAFSLKQCTVGLPNRSPRKEIEDDKWQLLEDIFLWYLRRRFDNEGVVNKWFKGMRSHVSQQIQDLRKMFNYI